MKYVFCGDLHIRSLQPENRKDNILRTSLKKLSFMIDYSTTHNIAAILVAGDFTDKPHNSESFIYKIINILKEKLLSPPIYTVMGQHDIEGHNIKSLNRTTLGILNTTHNLNVLSEQKEFDSEIIVYPFHFGQKLKHPTNHSLKKKICLAHKMVIDTPLWPDQKATKALTLLKKSKYDVIVTGDNHKSFTLKYKDKRLINCGSMLRLNIDQKDHRPRFYIWNSVDNTLKKVYFPIEKNVFIKSRKRVLDKDIELFTSTIRKGYDVTFSFRKNLDSYFEKNKKHRYLKKSTFNCLQENTQ